MPVGWPAVEAAWMAIAAPGLLFAAFNLIDAIGDRRAIARAGANGLRRIVATAGVWLASALAIGPAAFVAVGLVALNAPDPAGAPSANALLLLVALFAAALAFALAGLAIILGRRAALYYLDVAEIAARIEAARRDRRETDRPHRRPGEE